MCNVCLRFLFLDFRLFQIINLYENQFKCFDFYDAFEVTQFCVAARPIMTMLNEVKLFKTFASKQIVAFTKSFEFLCINLTT